MFEKVNSRDVRFGNPDSRAAATVGVRCGDFWSAEGCCACGAMEKYEDIEDDEESDSGRGLGDDALPRAMVRHNSRTYERCGLV